MTFGQKIARRRLELGLQQKDIADRMGVKPPYISIYERDTKTPKLATVRKFATALECSPSDLIDVDDSDAETEEPAPPPFVHPQKRLNAAVERLNFEGIKKTADYAEDLVENPKYQKDPASDTDHNPEG